MARTVSLKLLIGVGGGLLVVIVAVVIMLISTYLNEDHLRDVGDTQADILAQVARIETEAFFNKLSQDANTLQTMLRQDGEFMLPSDNPTEEHYKRWLSLAMHPLIGSNFTYTHIFMMIADDSVLRVKLMDGQFLTRYLFNGRTQQTYLDMLYYPNMSLVPPSEHTYYPFPARNSSSFPAFNFGLQYTNNSVGSSFWQGSGKSAFPPAINRAFVAIMHNVSDTYLGLVFVAQGLSSVSEFLQNELGSAQGVSAFVVDEGGFLVGSSLDIPVVTHTPLASRENVTNTANCAISPPTDPVVVWTCRVKAVDYPYSLLQRAAVSQSSFRGFMEDEGERYYVRVQPIRNIQPLRFGITMYVFYSEETILENVEQVRYTSIGTGIAIAVVCAVILFLCVAFSLRPLDTVVVDMQRAARLKPKRETELSKIAEVRALQLASDDLGKELHRIKMFVPHALMAGAEGSTTIEGSGGPTSTTSMSPLTDTELSPSEAPNPLELSDTDPQRGRAGVSGTRLREEQNVFFTKRATVLTFGVSALPDDTVRTQEISTAIMSVIVHSAERHNGVIDMLTPKRCVLSFGAHVPSFQHEKKAVVCALSIANKLSAADPSIDFSVVVDTSKLLVGTVGAGLHRSRTMVGEAVDVCAQLLSLAHTYLGTRVVVTDRVVRSADHPSVPIDVVKFDWAGNRESTPIVLYEVFNENAEPEGAGLVREAFPAFVRGKYDVAYQKLHKHTAYIHAKRLVETCTLHMEQQQQAKEYCRSIRGNWEPEGNTVIEARHVAQPVEETTAIERAGAELRDRVEAKTTAVEKEGGLVSMFEFASSSDQEGGATELPLTITDTSGTEWHRSLHQVARGGSCEVFKGMSITGTQAAMKFMPLSLESDANAIVDEITTLSNLRHDNIVNYYGCAVLKNYVVIVMEFAGGGTLNSLPRNFGRIALPTLRHMFLDVLHGLEFLHRHSVIHCDIKPENILLTLEGTAKVTDFGVSAQHSRSATSYADVRGTAAYMAPEVASGRAPTASSDVWSFGVLMLEMFTNEPPWGKTVQGGSKNEALFLEKLCKDDTMVPTIDDAIALPTEARSVIAACCVRDPRARLPAAEILTQPFFL